MGFVAAMTLGVASWLAGAEAPPPKQDPFESLMEEAGYLAEQGRYASSRQRFAASYEMMPPEMQRGELGRFAVEQATESFLRGEQSLREVEAMLVLLDRYFTALERARSQGEPAVAPGPEEERLTALRQTLLARLDEKPAEDALPIEHQAVPPRHVAPAAPRAGLGLIISGSVLAVGGATLLGRGLHLPRLVDAAYARSLADAQESVAQNPDLYIDEEQWALARDRQHTIAHVLTGVGAGVLAVGGALLTWGIVRAVRSHRGTSRGHRDHVVALGKNPTALKVHF